ncbi:MAG: isoprenyl transferase [Gammaproteobacteria bacterium]
MTDPDKNKRVPRHIAIVMDGNGRWAIERGLPRTAGHHAGVRALRAVIEHCARVRIEYMTVFAFSSENWQRPQQEVRMLMDLFITSLRDEVDELHKNNIRLSFIGGRDTFTTKLRASIEDSEARTRNNTGLHLVVAADYGGRWDITRACTGIAEEIMQGRLKPMDINESMFAAHLCTAGMPEPDLFIRTGGEQRISNYLLWQCAYSELYFTDVLWPDFSDTELERALSWYGGRQRRFGRIDEQKAASGNA